MQKTTKFALIINNNGHANIKNSPQPSVAKDQHDIGLRFNKLFNSAFAVSFITILSQKICLCYTQNACLQLTINFLWMLSLYFLKEVNVSFYLWISSFLYLIRRTVQRFDLMKSLAVRVLDGNIYYTVQLVHCLF